MADVFVSYSRADGAFVRELHDFLTGKGKDVWVDWEDIPPASQWEQDINDNIDAADSLVFVISEHSLASEYCNAELRHAGAGGKRIVPIACDGADPAKASEGLRQLNWIWCRATDDRAAAFDKLLQALDTDLAWARAHTRLLVRAVEWDSRRDSSLLLRGRDLEDALQQFAANAGKEPVPTELQREYLVASRRSSTRRQRTILASVSVALLVSVSLGILALLQRNAANERARVARSQAFAAQAVEALDSTPAAALADAVKAMDTHRTPEARVALRRALLANPVAYAIPASRAESSRGSPAQLSFSADGNALLGLRSDGMHVWRSADGRPQGRTTKASTFAQNGQLMIEATRRKATVRDVRTGARRDSLRAPRGLRIIGVGFSRGVPRVAMAGRNRLVLTNVPAGKTLASTVRGPTATGALFDREGGRLITYGPDTAARVWNARSARLLATLPSADSVAIDPRGRYVALVYPAGTSALWRVDDRARVADLGAAEGVRFSPDGRLVVAVGDNGGAGVWRVKSGSQIAAFPGFGSLTVPGASSSSPFSPGAAFNHDGTLVAVADADGNVRVWEVASGKQVGAVGAGWANALAFAPRGRSLAAMTWNGDVVVARAPASIPLRTGFRPSSCVAAFEPVISPNGEYVLARASGGAGVWTSDGRRVATFTPPAQPAILGRGVGSARFSPDGTMVTAEIDSGGCVISVDEHSGEAIWRLDRPGRRVVVPRGSVVADRDGKLVAVRPDQRLRRIQKAVATSADETIALVLRRHRLDVIRTASGMTVAELHGAGSLVQDARDYVAEVRLSPDGRRLLARQGFNVRLWDATSGEPIALLGRKGEEVGDFAFGDGGRLVLATFGRRAAVVDGRDGPFGRRAAVFDARDGRLVSSVPGSFDGAAFSRDAALAAVPQTDGGIGIVDLATGTRVSLPTDTAVRLTSVAFGPTRHVLVAEDEHGDVHVVGCEICAPENDLLALARARLGVLRRVKGMPPPVSAVA